jgi:hypothetical protein
MMSYEQAARALNVNVDAVRRLLASGEITASPDNSDLLDRASVESFHAAERERVGLILQEMVREAEDMGLYDIEPLPFRR